MRNWCVLKAESSVLDRFLDLEYVPRRLDLESTQMPQAPPKLAPSDRTQHGGTKMVEGILFSLSSS